MRKNVMNESSEAVTNMEDAIALIGGFGRFQWLMSIITMGNYIRSAFFYYPLPYMELLPEYTCTYPDGTVETCKTEDWCGKDDVIAEVNWNADRSLHNWVEQLDLACKSDTAVGLIGSTYFYGILISVTFLPRISDLYGRKWPILAC